MSTTPVFMQPDTSVLLVVDVQDNLLPAIHEADRLVEADLKMIQAARLLGVPILLTEQYPKGLGRTCATLLECLDGVPPIEKTRFSGCVEPVVRRLQELARPNVVVVGIEAHVCVQQTVLDLLHLGYTAYVCADGVSSRRPFDRDTALKRLARAGAVVTTCESAIFELMGEAGTDTFKQMLKIVK